VKAKRFTARELCNRGDAFVEVVLAAELGTARAERDEARAALATADKENQERWSRYNQVHGKMYDEKLKLEAEIVALEAERDEARAALAKRSGVAELRGLEAANRVLRAERDEARAALAVPHDSSINHPHEYAPDYREMYHTERGCAMKMMRGKQDAETLVVSLRAELEQAKAEIERLHALYEHYETDFTSWQIVTAPSDEDLAALIVALREKGIMPGKRHLRAALSAVADLARAKETTP
jgi:hypothetical protein